MTTRQAAINNNFFAAPAAPSTSSKELENGDIPVGEQNGDEEAPVEATATTSSTTAAASSRVGRRNKNSNVVSSRVDHLRPTSRLAARKELDLATYPTSSQRTGMQ